MQDQVFAARQVCEKYLANGKDVSWAFMDLEKAYGTIDLAICNWPCVLLDRPPVLWWLSPRHGWDAVT